jgi:hypothetical protein
LLSLLLLLLLLLRTPSKHARVLGFEPKGKAEGEAAAAPGAIRRVVHDLRFFGAAGELPVDTLRWDVPIHVIAVGPVARAGLHPPIHRLKFAAAAASSS